MRGAPNGLTPIYAYAFDHSFNETYSRRSGRRFHFETKRQHRHEASVFSSVVNASLGAKRLRLFSLFRASEKLRNRSRPLIYWEIAGRSGEI
jgi:hypothetical protein